MGNLPLRYGKPGRINSPPGKICKFSGCLLPVFYFLFRSAAACCRATIACFSPVAVTYCLLERIISLSEMFGLR